MRRPGLFLVSSSCIWGLVAVASGDEEERASNRQNRSSKDGVSGADSIGLGHGAAQYFSLLPTAVVDCEEVLTPAFRGKQSDASNRTTTIIHKRLYMEPNSRKSVPPVPLHTAGSASWSSQDSNVTTSCVLGETGLLNNATIKSLAASLHYIGSIVFALVSLPGQNLASTCYACRKLRQPPSTPSQLRGFRLPRSFPQPAPVRVIGHYGHQQIVYDLRTTGMSSWSPPWTGSTFLPFNFDTQGSLVCR